MRDTTVEATALKLFDACGTSWLLDSYNHWNAVVKAWSVGATRSLHDEDRRAIISAVQAMEEEAMSDRADGDSYGAEDAA
ncbi:hypothetical protein [Sinorhizobium meliloti]|uniref:hypothetical protein n=1 Tax=Rhizobium meliloti TaxID=382 RepID=UPI001AECDFBF|nr:hypothetical protein [Sinorhizobium meliloti]